MDNIVFDDSKYTDLPGLSLFGFIIDDLYLSNFVGSNYQSEFVYLLAAFWSKISLIFVNYYSILIILELNNISVTGLNFCLKAVFR